jgi:hypothetical protein
MPNITIDNREYDLDSLSETARAQIFHIQAAELEINRMNTLIAVMQSTRKVYLGELKTELAKGINE